MLILPGLLVGWLASLSASPATGDEWTIRAATVHTVSGKAIENGVVHVEGKKIAAVGKGGGGGDVLECAAVTPGLIDLAVQLDTGPASVEQSSETVARLAVADALDLFSFRWAPVLASGVTTALALPPDHDVIGGLGVVLKTGGEPTLAARLVRADAVLRGAIGSQPSNGSRRASTSAVRRRAWASSGSSARRCTTRCRAWAPTIRRWRPTPTSCGACSRASSCSRSRPRPRRTCAPRSTSRRSSASRA
jgi:hypothetical protein